MEAETVLQVLAEQEQRREERQDQWQQHMTVFLPAGGTDFQTRNYRNGGSNPDQTYEDNPENDPEAFLVTFEHVAPGLLAHQIGLMPKIVEVITIEQLTQVLPPATMAWVHMTQSQLPSLTKEQTCAPTRPKPKVLEAAAGPILG